MSETMTQGSEQAGQPEVLLRPEEIKFFQEYAKGPGYIQALALARTLDQPYHNVSQVEDRMSPARKRLATISPALKRQMAQSAELGGFEYRTAQVVAIEFAKTLKQAEKEGLFKGEVVVNVIDGKERKMLSVDEYIARLKQGTEGLMIIGVIAAIDGDDPEGSVVLMRNDMDALQMASGEIMHSCGHNIHTGWSIVNLKALLEYKKKFGVLPFRKVIFVSESNEEANAGAGDMIAPNEMIESGFIDRFGQVDCAIGMHVIASLPENTMRIEEAGFHGAADYTWTIRPTEAYRPGVDADLRLVAPEVARLVNEEFKADEPNEHFGQRKLVENDDGTVVPPIYVRLTAAQEQQPDGSYGPMAMNSLGKEMEYQGMLYEPDAVSSDDLASLVQAVLIPWGKLGFNVKAETGWGTDGNIRIKLETPGTAHVAFGGPNLRQLMGEIFDRIENKTHLVSKETPAGIKFGGTMRLLRADYKEVGEEVAEKLQAIAGEVLWNLNLEGRVSLEFMVQNAIGPTMNNPSLVAEARAVAEEAGIKVSRTNMPHAGAESFGMYEPFLKPGGKMAYFLVGAMKEELARRLLETGESLTSEALHHSQEFTLSDTAIPYGVMLDALMIQYARSWKRDHQK